MVKPRDSFSEWVQEYLIVDSIQGLTLCFEWEQKMKNVVNINNNMLKIQLWKIDFTSTRASKYMWCALAWMNHGNSGFKDKDNFYVLL